MNKVDHQKNAVRVLYEGGVVIFPTDTAFGIGCRVDDIEAVKKVFNIRRRPVTQATPVLFSSLDMIKKYVTSFPEDIKVLTDKYWPGALTIILPANLTKVPPLVRGGGLTVGVRIPNHKETLKIINNLGTPIIGPSANFHGEQTPFDMADIDPRLYSLVDYIVPGVCSVKKESTVIDCSINPWKILRPGAVYIE